jgi:hypothetical protein
VEHIVIEQRTMSRVLALIPAIVVAVAVRALTLGSPPLAVRLPAAAGVALACWVAYRLLTARVTVGATGVEVRGVLYDATISYAELEAVDVARSGQLLRGLVWGVMQPQTLTLHTASRRLRPIATIGNVDDETLERAIGAMRVRLGAGRAPAQRQPHEREVEVNAG